MAGARQAQGRVGLRVAPIGLEFCVIGRSMNIRSARAGLGLHLEYCILGGTFLAQQGAGVCSVQTLPALTALPSRGMCHPDICFMVSPSHVIVIVWVCGRPGVRVCGCVGDWVFFLFILVRLSPYQ